MSNDHCQVPVWFVAWLAAILTTWTAGRTGDRSIHIMVLLIVSAVGNAITTGATNLGARMFGMYLVSTYD